MKGAGTSVLLLCFLMTMLFSGCNALSKGAQGAWGMVQVTKYYTYGTFFQLEGTATYPDGSDERPEEIETVSLVLRSGTGEEDEVYRSEIPFSVDKKTGTLTFWSSDKLDEGLCLDTLPKGDYVALLETVYDTGDIHLWGLKDGTGRKGKDPEAPIDYYTLPYRHGRRHVTTEFQSFGDLMTLVFHIKRSRLPSDIYDIVVDPGHGGKDPGAQSGGYRESDVVLDIGKKLADALESAGYKVLLTRDGTEDPNVNMAYTEYDKDGRVNLTCGSRAKLALSLHLNYNAHSNQNGVQIYRANKAGNDYAKALADALVDATALEYSTMGGRTAQGVYVKTFTNGDIREAQSKARKKGYTFYDVSTATDYYFMVREYGCIATGAYVDGRNPDYGTNEYRNYHQGVESCLCELGFLSNEHDRQVLLNDQRGIARALTRAVDDYIAALHENQGPQTADLLAKETL